MINFFRLQTIKFTEGRKFIEHSNRIAELGSELESAGHTISSTERSRALISGLLRTSDVKAWKIMVNDMESHDAVSKLSVREI